MNAGQKSARRVVSGKVLSRDTVCNSCLQRLSPHTTRRHASAAIAAAAEEPPRVQANDINPPVTQTGPQQGFKVACSPIISRPPLLTRELTSFEKAFYLYQKRLNERQALPFTRYFYYKRQTPAGEAWKRKVLARKGVAARDVGHYNAYDENAWNDEVLVGSKLGEPEDIVEKLIRDAEGKEIDEAKLVGDSEAEGKEVSGDATAGEGVRKPVGDLTVERPLSRVTEADKSNDIRSLNRKLDRSLYLMIKNKDGQWRFPSDRIYGRENMNQAAERIILQIGGMNMNTWVVGNHPIGHFISSFETPKTSKIPPNRLVSTSKHDLERTDYGEKIFFMKARIMAGQLDLSKNEYDDQDFAWLSKGEIESRFEKTEPLYWKWIRNVLTDR